MCVFLRFLKKRQKLLDKLLSSARGSGDAGEPQQRPRHRPDLPVPEPSEETEAGPETRGSEGAWPESVAAVKGAWSVGETQDCLVSMRDGSEGVCPVGVAAVEGAWSVGVAQDSLVSAERLFVFRCVPPAAQQNTQTSHSRKKRNFLNFKKSSVAPQPNT